MPADDERREVAARLMDEVGCGSSWPGVERLGLILDIEREPRTGWEGRILTRLADLIYPGDMSQGRRDIVACDRDAPGHEHIQRSEPAYPDATASYKGWRSEVYDPDGVLVSPSNVAADLVRAHADGKGSDEPEVRCVAEVKVDGEQLEQLVHDVVVELTGIDRDKLLELADEMTVEKGDIWRWSSRIREALGVTDA